MAFRREKYVPRGGPSGGDGGRGGDIIMVATIHRNTLLHFRFNPEYTAQRGRHGEGSNCTGMKAKALPSRCPSGTTVYDEETGETLFDFTEDGQTWLAAKGGRGGRGNQHFATATHQAPTEHEAGKPGDFKKLRLELRLLADVGLVGYPNAGKSTLISRISAARPKIADYPFTTLEPNLGVVQMPDLRHLRCGRYSRAHRRRARRKGSGNPVPEACGTHESSGASGRHVRDRPRPVHDFETLMKELEASTRRWRRSRCWWWRARSMWRRIRRRSQALRRLAEARKLPFFEISSATGQGIEALKFALADRSLPPMPAPAA